MIMSMALENWMSFRDRVTFMMVAGKERQHGERITKLRSYQTRILPLAALYGGNASGKSNFIKALAFSQHFVVVGTRPDRPILVEPFRLDPDAVGQPTRFMFELLIGTKVYEFSFAVTRKSVIEERLVEIAPSRETVLYERKAGTITFADRLNDTPFLDFAFRGTRENQLFLTNAISQKVDTFRPIYDWFEKKLIVITPKMGLANDEFLDKDHPGYAKLSEMLNAFDTGVEDLDLIDVPLDRIKLPEHIKSVLFEKVDTTYPMIYWSSEGELIRFSMEKGVLVAKKTVTRHRDVKGDFVTFELGRESDGTRRILELLPLIAWLSESQSDGVLAIDELDRRLHSLVTRKFIEMFLGQCHGDHRGQLIFTTHDLLLMDQDLLRRDEMWVTERDRSGVSKLFSFSDFRGLRYDKDLRKSYLQGRFGGIPRITLPDYI